VRRRTAIAPERGQALVLVLGLLGALLLGPLVLAAFGEALGAKGRHQRAADLAAISAARAMRDLYARLFEPPYLDSGAPNPRHLSTGAYSAWPGPPPFAAVSGTGCVFA
jgi:Putative Flp pilus-assembly TadE/G-like